MTERDWEDLLRRKEFDLPKERWARLEVDLLRRIREPVAPLAWHQRLVTGAIGALRWLRPVPVAAGLASLFLSLGWWYLHEHRSAGSVAQIEELKGWTAGAVLHSDSLKVMNWGAARCTLALQGDVRRLEGEGGQRLRLEKGRIRFGVQPRRPNEVFSVEFGSCKATVVGTAFTLQVDSLGAIASVEHGKVRIDALSGLSRLLTQGQSLSCRDLTQGPVHKNDAVEPIATPKPPVPVVAVPSSLEEQEWERLWSGCKQPSEKCTESLAAYLQSHPTGERAGKCAQLWADRSMARGDYRDALYALDLAAHANAGELSFKARLKACSIKAMELNQASQALKDLDALLVGLPEGVRKSAAMQLRADLVAREKNSGSDPANLP